jgi:hypothetical protein
LDAAPSSHHLRLDPEASDPRQCHVLLELVRDPSSYDAFHLEKATSSSLPTRPKRLRVLHDATYKLSSQNVVTPIRLRCSLPLFGIDVPTVTGFQREMIYNLHLPVPRYTIHLSATGTRERGYLFSQIPPDSLLLIARHIMIQNSGVRRRNLLSFGLVCKAWSRCLNVFFSTFDGQLDGPMPGGGNRMRAPKLIVQSLQWRPERALLIQSLSIDSFRMLDEVSLDAFTELLSLARAVKRVKIKRVPSASLPKLLSALQSLTALEEFIVKADTMQCFDAIDLLQVSANWANLKAIRGNVGQEYVLYCTLAVFLIA